MIAEKANELGLSILNKQNQQIMCPIALHPTIMKQEVYNTIETITYQLSHVLNQIACETDILYSLKQYKDLLTLQLLDQLDVKKSILKDMYQSHLQFGVFSMRSDFLCEKGKPFLVECNTIAAGMAPLGQLTSTLHKQLGHLVNNDGLTVQTEYFISLIKQFKDSYNVNGIFLVIQQTNENNIFDHIALANSLKQKGVQVQFCEYQVLCGKIQVSSSNILFYENQPVACAYYRCGYQIEDYYNDFATRMIIECANCFSIPSIEAQLAGMKPLQQMYGELNSNIKSCLKNITGLDNISVNLDQYVLKCSAEGGGACVFGANDINTKIQQILKNDTQNQYFLMELINPDSEGENTFISQKGSETHLNTVTEFGLFSYFQVNMEKVVIGGYLARTKDIATKEGGVHCGAAVSNSVIFI
ncbi:Glutathione_synthetase [Hexamita inflata]|uniref:Glutathione synthetase n=1 Tax=Hexamita inflata TaxID=28002 RepID=A0AA86N5U0_9EUKA|nr:Glutathione synthetase [Hexamita inflata]CAI9915628.1 Glutathione synthetase [Hexamita inflata]